VSRLRPDRRFQPNLASVRRRQFGFRCDLPSYILGREFNAAGRRANRPGIPPSIAPRISHDWNEVRLSSSVSSFFGSRPGEHRTSWRDPNAIGLAYGNAHSNSNSDAYGHTDTFGNTHSDSHPHGHADPHGHTDTFGNTHSDSHPHGHADAHGHTDTFGNTHSDSHAHGHADAHSHADTFGNTHSDSHAHGHANAFGNAHSDSDTHVHANTFSNGNGDTHGHADGNTDGNTGRPLPLLQGEDCAGFRSLRKARSDAGG